MKQIFRNSNQNNINKTATHKIYVETQNRRKPRAATPTQNPLSYELVQNDFFSIQRSTTRETQISNTQERDQLQRKSLNTNS